MKTTIKKRLLRLGILIGTIMGLVMVLVGAIDVCIVSSKLYKGADFINHTAPYILIMLGMYVSLTIGTIIISRKVANNISAAVNSVTERITKLSTGDVMTDFQVNDRGDETQVLAESLDNTLIFLRSYINDIDDTLQNISDGDLRKFKALNFKGDFVNIENSLKNITVSLRDVMKQINIAGVQVLSDSETLAASAQVLAENTSSEAATLEELNAMTNEISVKVENNVNNTERATVLSETVVKNIKTGNNNMEEMSVAINEIKTSSAEIQAVIKIIDDIAFQTNILALNAAVEAARAGTAGKGFSVVADEVRNLAAKSAEAVKHTSELIDRCATAVNKGADITDSVYASFQTIDHSVAEFGNLIDEINVSSQEQSLAIQQINVGLTQITNSIQSNSATAEESAASSEELSSQANVLHNKVSRFKI